MRTFSRISSAAMLLTWAALAGPPMTTIQDTLYKADGTRFNGLVNIAWGGFEASDQSAIANQVITVKIVNGRLNVQLARISHHGSLGTMYQFGSSDLRGEMLVGCATTMGCNAVSAPARG